MDSYWINYAIMQSAFDIGSIVATLFNTQNLEYGLTNDGANYPS